MRKVETLPSGKYKVRFRLPSTSPAGKPKQTSETFDKKREAEEFAAWLSAVGPQGALDLLYEAEQDKTVPDLDTVAAEHIAHKTGITEGTRLGDQRLWDRTWSPLIGALPANRWGRDEVRLAINQLAQRYAPKSLMNQRGLLAGVGDRCIEKGYLTQNPTKKLRLPQGRTPSSQDELEDDDDPTEMVCLTYAQWDRLYEAFAEQYRPFVRFLVGTGCRWGEAVVLQPRDINLEAKTVRIRRALKWSPDGKREIGPPKTTKGRRTITLPADVADDLAVLMAGKGATEFVFTQARGGMLVHRNFWSRYWGPGVWRAQRCVKHLAELVDAGCLCGSTTPARCRLHDNDERPEPCGCPGTLAEAPRIHDLRHTHASWLLAQGVPIHVVQIRLGHESIQTTVDTYTHLMPDAQQLAADAAALAFTTGPKALR